MSLQCTRGMNERNGDLTSDMALKGTAVLHSQLMQDSVEGLFR